MGCQDFEVLRESRNAFPVPRILAISLSVILTFPPGYLLNRRSPFAGRICLCEKAAMLQALHDDDDQDGDCQRH